MRKTLKKRVTRERLLSYCLAQGQRQQQLVNVTKLVFTHTHLCSYVHCVYIHSVSCLYAPRVSCLDVVSSCCIMAVGSWKI